MRCKIKAYIRVIALVVILSLCSGIGMASAELVWQTSKETAVSMARDQGKDILLLAGRIKLLGGLQDCPNCEYMIKTVFESTSPPIKALIEEEYILWYSDWDTSRESRVYASGLGETFTLPLICIIDPNDSDTYVDRTTNVQDTQVFYLRLKNHGEGGDSGGTPAPGGTTSGGDDGGGGGGCFIATAAYGSPMEEHVRILRDFRDRFLLTNPAGKVFVDIYYSYSPYIADFITEHETLRSAVRLGLLPFVGLSWVMLNIDPVAGLGFILFLCSGFIGLAGFARKSKRI
jgi:hypothetical protein